MSLAFFIMAHHKPQQLRALIEAISGRGDLVLLHVDLKSALGLRAGGRDVALLAGRMARTYPNVVLMRPRFTNWGGWSLSALHLKAIDQALRLRSDWTHFINLSGQCHPLKTIDEIRDGAHRLEDVALVERKDLGVLPPDDWHHRWRSMLETPIKAYPLPWRRRAPSGFDLLHKGSQWSVLPRSFCEWQSMAPVRRRICRYLRGLHLTDELVIQALIDNSPWTDRTINGNGHEILWPGHTVVASDIPRLAKSEAWFTRKVDFERDEVVAEWLRQRVPVAVG